MSYPFGKTATIIPQTRDQYGDRTAGASTDVDGCAIWQTPGVEIAVGEDTVIYDLTMLAPSGTTVNATDRVTVDSITYEVVGQPIAWISALTGHKPGVEVHLRKVAG